MIILENATFFRCFVSKVLKITKRGIISTENRRFNDKIYCKNATR